MKVSIVTIGDEILIGQIVDTNSAWIAQRLNEIGLQVHKIYSIPDTEAAILRTLNRAAKLTDVVLLTGGLGPTNDDITKKTLATFFNDSLQRNEEVLAHLKTLFEKKGIKKLNKLNEQQADLPSQCKVLLNPVGTASGMWFNKDGKYFISMPGVPYEMKAIMSSIVLPKFQSEFGTGVFLHKTILTQGVPESVLAELLEGWESSLHPKVKLAFLPSESRVRLRLSIKGQDKGKLDEILDYEAQKLKAIIPEYIYGEENDRIEQRVGDLLLSKKATVATAESFTSGYLSHLITSVPGSSSYYRGSILAYDNEIKEKILNVSPDSIKNYGVVSEQVVKEMALSVKKIMGVDYALSTSGVAGPSGGTNEVPVGTIWIAIAGPYGVKAKKYHFGTDRSWNVKRGANTVLLSFLHQLESDHKKIK
tara:strand:- start:340 stop:1599 length:1260 start_codon:yes stop_codon:yes gene_type:complete